MRYQELEMLTNRRLAKQSVKSFLPVASISFSENDAVTRGAPDSRSKSLQFSLSQLVFDGGKNRAQYQLANINALYSFYEYQLAVKQFETQIITAYRQCLLLRRKQEIQRELWQNAIDQRDIIRAEYELGLVLETDYLEVALSAASIELQTKQLAEETGKQHRGLGVLLGMEGGTQIVIHDDLAAPGTYLPLGKHLDQLWPIVKAASVEMQKQEINYLYQKIQVKKAKNLFAPAITLEGGVGFSGAAYPMTQPSYSLKCSIAFNNPLLPVNLSAGVSARDGRLSGAQNSAGTSLPASVTHFTERHLQDIALVVGAFGLADSGLALHESLQNMVFVHDNAITDMEIKRGMLDIARRRIQIDRVRLEHGDLKRIDFLEEMIQAAEQETVLAETEFDIMAAERNLEIAASIPGGKLWRILDEI
jgi:outer membrane protein TolC